MKKLLVLFTALFTSCLLFAFDSSVFLPKGDFNSYTKTQYNVTSKFGDFYRFADYKDVVNYDDNGLRVEVLTYDAKDQFVEKVVYTYNEDKTLKDYTLSDSTGKIESVTKCEYSDGKLKSETEYDAKNAILTKTIYKYEANKNTEDFYNSNGELLTKKITFFKDNSEEVFEYNGDGELISRTVTAKLSDSKISTVEKYNDLNELESKTVYKYDDKGNTTEVQIYNAANFLLQRNIYKNDDKGNATRISIYSISEKFGTTVNELKTIVEYAYKY